VIQILTASLLALVCLVAGTVAGLRWRKLRRDELRAIDRRRSIEAMAPPESRPLRSVRLLDDGVMPQAHTEPVRPRLDPERSYVFTDLTLSDPAALATARARHNDQWALERSSHRSRLAPGSLRILLIVALALVVLIVVGTYLQHSNPPKATTTTSTTTTLANSAASWPHVLTAQSSSASQAEYSVPRRTYTVVVSGAHGPVWLVITMGPTRTLEYQGEVAINKSYAITLKGDGWVSLGSPHNAVVTVDQHAVTAPLGESAPFTMAFSPVAR
jgi:hypothetical protein